MIIWRSLLARTQTGGSDHALGERVLQLSPECAARLALEAWKRPGALYLFSYLSLRHLKLCRLHSQASDAT